MGCSQSATSKLPGYTTVKETYIQIKPLIKEFHLLLDRQL